MSVRASSGCLSLGLMLCLTGCELSTDAPGPGPLAVLSVAATPTLARSADGQHISWREHLIDDEQSNGGVPIRGGDGLVVADLDRDGYIDIISVHEDSNHLRVAYGSGEPDIWHNVTIAHGSVVAAIEDVAVGDLNGDGWPDLVAACEEAHLAYFQNPASGARQQSWPHLIPAITQGRGSWLRVFVADLDRDGRLDVLGANKGAADIIDPAAPSASRPTSLFLLDGDPLLQTSWREQELSREVVPNTAMPVDIDGDGDLDVLTAARLQQRMAILEVTGSLPDGGVTLQAHPIAIEAGFPVPADWRGSSSAFQSAFADLDGDSRPDLIVAVYEGPQPEPASPLLAGLGWLRQPEQLDQPWTYHRIGDILPDVVVGIALADIDGDGDLDAITGGYSGLNILAGSYSGASREFDEPSVTASSTVGRMAWFENPGDARSRWKRHDISRRVRGMVDAFVPRDLDGDGDVDLIATRGNSGRLDGVFWLEQVRTDGPQPAFLPARSQDSRALPLPPSDWRDHYAAAVRFVAPNKVAPEAPAGDQQ